MALSLNAPKNLPRVMGDAERVRQVIDNLVDNAYHYTPRMAPSKCASMRRAPWKFRWMWRITELALRPPTGTCLRAFYRGEHPLVLATTGTGLGLPIVKQLVEMHNGKIWMKSEGLPGKGSVFSFTLPIQKDK